MNPSIILGLGMGALNAVLTAAIFLYMLRSLVITFSLVEGLKIITEVTGIGTFWWGGNWAGEKLLGQTDWGPILPWYALGLAVLFIVLTIVPLLRFVARIAEEVKRPP